MSVRFVAFLAIAVVTFVCFRVSAANRVVILENTDEPVAFEIASELESYGFSTEIIPDTPAINLSDIAKKNAASAAIRLNLTGNQVEVWVADRITGKMVMRTITLTRDDKREKSIIVLAAVELLRASLMEIYAREQQTGTAADAATQKTRAFAKPSLPAVLAQTPAPKKLSSGYLTVGAGGAVIGKSAGIGGQGTLALTLAFNERVHFTVQSYLPIGGIDQKADAGKTSIYPFLTGVQSTVLFRSEQRRLRPYAGLGLGIAIFWAKGKRNPEYELTDAALQSHRETVIVPTPYAAGGILFRLTRQLQLRVSSLVGVSTASTRVKIADQTVAKLGRPVIFLDAGLDITLW